MHKHMHLAIERIKLACKLAGKRFEKLDNQPLPADLINNPEFRAMCQKWIDAWTQQDQLSEQIAALEAQYKALEASRNALDQYILSKIKVHDAFHKASTILVDREAMEYCEIKITDDPETQSAVNIHQPAWAKTMAEEMQQDLAREQQEEETKKTLH